MTMTHSPVVNFDFLMELRSNIGPIYGSEDLCILLYSIVKREKPAVVVELGTGLGVTTAWIAAAMKENGFGTIYTFDHGGHFVPTTEKPWWKEKFRGRLESLAPIGEYDDFVDAVFVNADVSDHVKFCRGNIDLHDLGWLDAHLTSTSPECNIPEIDILFSDYSHSAENTTKIIASFLPRMTEVSSIFIDSASTSLPSYWLLERIVQLFSQGKVPVQMLAHLNDVKSREKLNSVVATSMFKLMHLVEKQARAQNSTAWLRTERASLLPSLAISLH